MNLPLVRPSIAIVEDDADQLHSIEEFLADAGYPAWGAGSAEAFYRGFMLNPVDVVILDVGLPGEDGLAVANLLKGKPEVAVIILSARDSLNDRIAGLRAGADRYLVKPVNLLELVANIDAVAYRLALHQAPASDAAARAPAPEATPSHWTLSLPDWVLTSPKGQALKLTTHEFLFLQRLLKAHGQPVAKRELTDQLFGARTPNGSERLNLLVTRLRKKATEVLNEPLPIKTLHQIGYAFTASACVLQPDAPGLPPHAMNSNERF
ncbi:MAG: response regulator transcription factor [Burkholderiales bacterium]|nr:response regulator transcription factor [Burkholderiales bacterium]